MKIAVMAHSKREFSEKKQQDLLNLSKDWGLHF